MAHDESDVNVAGGSSALEGATPVSSGLAVISDDKVENPGFPEHPKRQTDLHPKKEKRAERFVYGLFFLSIAGSIWAITAYILFPIDETQLSVRLNTLFLGIGMAASLLGIGIGAVHWAKQLMSDHEGIDIRHETRGSDETRARAVEIFQEADQESGFGRRTLIRRSLIGALVAFPLPGVVLLRGLYNHPEDPVEALSHTMWEPGMRLTKDPSGVPIKAADVTNGSAFHVIPEGLMEREDWLEQKAKAVVLLMRVDPSELNELPERENWSYNGIVAYSKICTHVGCPVALYEQRTHHLLCPCHQSTFDVTNHCEVIFGPAARPLPQLPIAVDDEGYLIAQRDFDEPVGPSFWERPAT